MTPDDDDALLRAWQDGDKLAGDTLIKRHFSLVFRFLRPRAGQQTADLVQRSFLALAQAKGSIPAGVPVRAYLLGIARNQLLMTQRGDARRANVMSPGTASGPDGGPTPSGAAAMREEQRVLLQGLRLLPLEMQLAIELFYWEGLSRDEIATVLDVEPNTIKSRLQRAKDRLRALLPTLDPVTGSVTAADLDRWAASLRGVAELDDTP